MTPSFEVYNYASKNYCILFNVDNTKDKELIIDSILEDLIDSIGDNFNINFYFFKVHYQFNNISYNAYMNIELSEIRLLSTFITDIEAFKNKIDNDYINIKMIKLYDLNNDCYMKNYKITIKNGVRE